MQNFIKMRKTIYIYIGKEIPDLSAQQQGTESILVNFESLLFIDLCYGV